MKREDVSTLFICSYLQALSCQRTLKCFVKCVCVCFESFFEKCLRLGEICNDSRLYKNVYKVLTFENISFESVGVFEMRLF